MTWALATFLLPLSFSLLLHPKQLPGMSSPLLSDLPSPCSQLPASGAQLPSGLLQFPSPCGSNHPCPCVRAETPGSNSPPSFPVVSDNSQHSILSPRTGSPRHSASDCSPRPLPSASATSPQPLLSASATALGHLPSASHVGLGHLPSASVISLDHLPSVSAVGLGHCTRPLPSTRPSLLGLGRWPRPLHSATSPRPLPSASATSPRSRPSASATALDHLPSASAVGLGHLPSASALGHSGWSMPIGHPEFTALVAGSEAMKMTFIKFVFVVILDS